MKVFHAVSASVMVVVLLPYFAFAGTIVAKLDGVVIATAAAGGDLSVPVGVISNDRLLQIYDDATTATTPPESSVGTVTITGEVGAGSTPILRVLIANPVIHPVFPAIATANLLPGVTNLGVSSADGVKFENAGLRGASVVALSVSGDVLGNVEGGRVFRVQAADGIVQGTVTAWSGDMTVDPTPDESAIGVIRAGRGVHNITAKNGSIARVTVRPANDLGIAGDIRAKGRMRRRDL